MQRCISSITMYVVFVCPCLWLWRCQGDGWSAYSERAGLHKLLRKQTFESDFQPENPEKPVRNRNTDTRAFNTRSHLLNILILMYTCHLAFVLTDNLLLNKGEVLAFFRTSLATLEQFFTSFQLLLLCQCNVVYQHCFVKSYSTSASCWKGDYD